jgi:hypothetical protein
MARWHRTKKLYLVKSRRMTDGELLHLMLGKTPRAFSEFDGQVYQSLQGVKAAAGKAALWVLGSAAFAVLSHFRVLRGVRASGLDVAPEIFSHAALVGLSLSTAIFCFAYSKQTYMQVWFAWKFKSGSPALKAECLLRFPDAYWHFSYLPGAVGYPPFLIGGRNLWLQLAYVVLVLVSLVICAGGSFALWFVVARDVWNAPNLGPTVSLLTIILSAMVTLLGWTAPFYYDLPRRYTHNGLVELLTARQGDELAAAHLRVYRAALNMGLASRGE